MGRGLYTFRVTVLQAIILGIVQGVTEFIPVSSSGHLLLAQEALGVSGAGLSFDIALHFGTLLALIIFFHRDIWELILGLLGKNDKTRLAWWLIAATIPTMAVGFVIRDMADTTFRASALTAFTLISVALLMLLAEYLSKRRKVHTALQKVSGKQAMGVGLAQVLALIPGVSRSGSTITAGLLFGMDRVAATRFSFLLAIPITSGVVLSDLVTGDALTHNGTGILVAGISAALVSGIIAIRFLLKFLSGHSLAVFAWYRIALGILVLALIL